ncbi:hypothetical protein [Bradyrhizobium canariense]|uniref:Uncharacterized protein n=1 Tax=Bradyrhizobium canariense TaxID=255045 RepID=A0A1H1XCM5_9BRAD|nr:hypothetical protein [Bradyrhizobium canariense]SDT06801.1 hypothetical protein SAMN05444158_4258 [Bradyrhizobium canariense]
MTGFKLIGAALILSAGMATPVFAQEAISEPGAYAFYHPDGDVLHAGSAPARDALAMAVPHYSGRVARHGMRTMSHRTLAKRTDRYGME